MGKKSLRGTGTRFGKLSGYGGRTIQDGPRGWPSLLLLDLGVEVGAGPTHPHPGSKTKPLPDTFSRKRHHQTPVAHSRQITKGAAWSIAHLYSLLQLMWPDRREGGGGLSTQEKIRGLASSWDGYPPRGLNRGPVRYPA